MIFDNIKNRGFYAGNPKLDAVLAIIAELYESGTFPQEPVVLTEGEAFINPVTLTSRPEEQCIHEAHVRYADVHFIVEGTEKIVVTDISAVTIDTPYSEEKDIGFYKAEEGNTVVLKAGDFLVCWPQDAHKVAIAPGEPAFIRKLVGKVKV